MRPTLAACCRGLPLAAAVVLLAACGGSDEAESASSGPASSGAASSGAASSGAASSSASASSSSAAGTGAPAADSEFCRDAAAVQQRVAATFTGQSDLTILPTVLQQAVEDIRAIEPPTELDADWTAFGDGIEEVAVAARIDFDDPAARTTFQQQVGDLQEQYGTAFANVQTYLADQCGLTAGTPAPASPTG